MKPIERFEKHVMNGDFTLVLNKVCHRNEQVAQACRAFEEAFGNHPCQANAYFSPAPRAGSGGAQGFALHHDLQDAFVIQLSGRKAWQVCSPAWPVRLLAPWLERKPMPDDLASLQCEEFVLEQGDTLYLPRGFVHRASTDGVDASRGPSLHLTFGVASSTFLVVEVLHCAIHGFEAVLGQQAGALWPLLLRAATCDVEELREAVWLQFQEHKWHDVTWPQLVRACKSTANWLSQRLTADEISLPANTHFPFGEAFHYSLRDEPRYRRSKELRPPILTLLTKCGQGQSQCERVLKHAYRNVFLPAVDTSRTNQISHRDEILTIHRKLRSIEKAPDFNEMKIEL